MGDDSLNLNSLSDDESFVEWSQRPWQDRLAFVEQMMRDISRQTDPEDMVRMYAGRMRLITQSQQRVSLSRRDLQSPLVRVTRAENNATHLNPWKHRDRLPVLRNGLLSELIYAEKPVILNDFVLDMEDPSAPYLTGLKSICAIPLFEQGQAMNMVVLGRRDRAFKNEFLPEQVWLSNLFGRATANLVLKEQLRVAYERVDRELKVVADIQRSLLPEALPEMPGLDIAAYYQTAKDAGGDYYDFFKLPGGKLGILIADVSGHGTPAAVVMAVTHSIAHTHDGPPDPPSRLLNFINHHLASRYTNGTGTFVTAFYGIYDPATRQLRYANAGHNPPRLKRSNGGPNGIVEGAANLPLGIDPDEVYLDDVQTLSPGDILVLYTDGITEARAPDNQLFGTDRLDDILNQSEHSSQDLIDQTLLSVERFTHFRPPTDDRTMLVVQINS